MSEREKSLRDKLKDFNAKEEMLLDSQKQMKLKELKIQNHETIYSKNLQSIEEEYKNKTKYQSDLITKLEFKVTMLQETNITNNEKMIKLEEDLKLREEIIQSLQLQLKTMDRQISNDDDEHKDAFQQVNSRVNDHQENYSNDLKLIDQLHYLTTNTPQWWKNLMSSSENDNVLILNEKCGDEIIETRIIENKVPLVDDKRILEELKDNKDLTITSKDSETNQEIKTIPSVQVLKDTSGLKNTKSTLMSPIRSSNPRSRMKSTPKHNPSSPKPEFDLSPIPLYPKHLRSKRPLGSSTLELSNNLGDVNISLEDITSNVAAVVKNSGFRDGMPVMTVTFPVAYSSPKPN